MRGASVKGYEVWGQLSAGGMGDVWLARHSELALPVVIKTLHPSPNEDFDARYRRLLQEARLTARLTNPRVVRVMDVGVYTDPDDDSVESTPFLVEEYVDGIDLAELDRRRRAALRRPLPLWAVCDVLGKAAEALHAAHQAGVVHRDVKPSNLFGHGHADIKLGDFGVAITREPVDTPHVAAGTPLFMSPEHLLGGELDRRADVYSLGATGFALRYGTTPFESVHEVLRADCFPRFPPARTPEEAYFQHVIARMMSRRADARPASLHPVIHQLRALAKATLARIPVARAPGTHAWDLGRTRVSFEVGDLAAVPADGVVNSANYRLTMRTGVGRALRERGGDEVEAEAMASGEHALGDCVITGPGKLACRGIIHAVGAWNEVSCIGRATHRALLIAEEQGYTSLAFPAVGTGTGRVSIESCADAMVGALRLHLALGGSRLRDVRFVLVDRASHERFVEVAEAALHGPDDPPLFDDEIDAPVGPDESTAHTVFAPPSSALSSPPPPAATPSSPPVMPRLPTERIE